MPVQTLCHRFLLLFLPVLLCGPLAAQDNPFLSDYKTPFGTPPFGRIKTAHYLPAVQAGIKEQQAEIDAIANDPAPPTFANTMEALDRSGVLLGRAASVYNEMLLALTGEELQQAANQIAPLMAAHNDNISLNGKLFARVNTLYGNRTSLGLNNEQMYLLTNKYREFVRNGALLTGPQKERMRTINQELSLLSLKFDDNLLAETNTSYIVIDKQEDLAGLPPGIIATGAETAQSMNMPGKWVFTTQRPSWTPFLQYSERRPLRDALYTAYCMRGDRDNVRDNKAILQQILCLREERARLLGYRTPAHFYLEERMAKNPETLATFLDRLWKPAVQRAKREVADMQSLIDREQGGFKLAPADWWYYAEKVRKARYDLDDTALRPYFQLEKVHQGVFTLANKLFGLTFHERNDLPVYHPDVLAYEVKEAGGTHLGILYMDFFPRDSKQGGAWSGSFRSAYYEKGRRIAPIANLVCNFTKPAAGTPALLSIDEVLTYFHEFGHALNTLFYNGTYRTTYTPQDSVELPSQIMEHWALEPELLKVYAKHYQTGEVIPESLVAKLKQSSLFNQGFETVEYLAACYLDLAWHSLESAANVNVTRFEERTFADLGLIPEIVSRYRSTYFGHIIGGYAAGYYSYIWSGVLDADAFEAFKETSLFDQKVAASFRTNILERLGTEDAGLLYQRFRGREPRVEPLLRQRGLLGN